jgi:hypothetical protein
METGEGSEAADDTASENAAPSAAGEGRRGAFAQKMKAMVAWKPLKKRAM